MTSRDPEVMWEYRGQKRPSFAEKPGPGQQSVWDYPRPPAIEVCTRVVEVKNNSVEVARSVRACRVLETASPPAFYIPPQDVDWSKLAQAPGSSICEWKGIASYWALSSNPVRGVVAWSYAEPRARFKSICNYVSFYPALLAQLPHSSDQNSLFMQGYDFFQSLCCLASCQVFTGFMTSSGILSVS
jgi:uncharacterized protein (DUF427 family)